FCAHTPPSGHSLSVVQGAEDAAGLASSGAVGGACGGHFVGGGSPGIWGNLPVMAVVACTLFGFCGVAPMATRLLYLLMAMVKYVSSPSSDVASHGSMAPYPPAPNGFSSRRCGTGVIGLMYSVTTFSTSVRTFSMLGGAGGSFT